MKKNLMIFGIIMTLSIIPISRVKALTGNNGVEYPNIPEDGHTQFIIGKENNDNEIKLLTFSEEVKYFAVTDWNSNSGGRVGPFFYASGVFGDWDGNTSYKFSTKEYILKNGEWSLNSSYTSYTCNTIAYMTPLYSTMNIYFDGTTSTSTFPSGYYYISGEHNTGDLVYSANVVEYMTFNSNLANDLNGVEFYNIRFNAINYNSEYQYLIKTGQEIEWTDITELLDNEAFQYDYSLYYNTTLYMQVLDNDNNILETKTYTISDLEEFGFKFTITDANDLQNRFINSIKIDLTNCYIDNYIYRYTYGIGNNKVYYNLEPNSDNKIFYLNHAIYSSIYFEIVTPDGDNVIYEDEIDKLEFLDLKKSIVINKKTSYLSNQKVIEIEIDFSQFENFSDIYNFEYFQYKLENDIVTDMILVKNFTINESNFDYYKNVYFEVEVDNELLATVNLIDYIYGDFDTIYNETLEEEMMSDLEEQDYSTIPGMVEAIKNFIKATGEFITTFFELIMYFFNKLNIWIRTCIISLFIELIIFKIIKAVRK